MMNIDNHGDLASDTISDPPLTDVVIPRCEPLTLTQGTSISRDIPTLTFCEYHALGQVMTVIAIVIDMIQTIRRFIFFIS